MIFDNGYFVQLDRAIAVATHAVEVAVRANGEVTALKNCLANEKILHAMTKADVGREQRLKEAARVEACEFRKKYEAASQRLGITEQALGSVFVTHAMSIQK